MDEEMFKVNELLCEILEKLKDKDPIMKALFLDHKIDNKRRDLPTRLEKLEPTKLEVFIQLEEEFLNKINELLEDDINE